MLTCRHFSSIMCTVKGRQKRNILSTLGHLIMLTLQRMMECLLVSLPATMIQLVDGICLHKMGSQIIYAGTMKYRMTKVYHFAWGKQNHFLHRKIHPLHKWRSAHSMIFLHNFYIVGVPLPWTTWNTNWSSVFQLEIPVILVWMHLLVKGGPPQRLGFQCSLHAGGMQNR